MIFTEANKRRWKLKIMLLTKARVIVGPRWKKCFWNVNVFTFHYITSFQMGTMTYNLGALLILWRKTWLTIHSLWRSTGNDVKFGHNCNISDSILELGNVGDYESTDFSFLDSGPTMAVKKCVNQLWKNM